MGPHLLCFLFGMAGNTGLEIVRLLSCAQRGRYHGKYKDWRFWLLRVLFVLIAGVMALAYSLTGLSSPFVAFHVGAAASYAIERMAVYPPPVPEQSTASSV